MEKKGECWFSLILPSDASVSSFPPNLSQDQSLEGPEWQSKAPLGFWPGRFAQEMRVTICLPSSLVFLGGRWASKYQDGTCSPIAPMGVPPQITLFPDVCASSENLETMIRKEKQHPRLCLIDVCVCTMMKRFCYQKVWEMFYIFPFGP